MRVIVLGTSELILYCTRVLFDVGVEVCALVSMPEDVRPDNSMDTENFAKNFGIDYYEVEDVNSAKSLKMLRGYRPDYIFASWPRVLGEEVLRVPRYYCIGTHPTDLPFNRGRHPLHWLVALGISETKLSFFRMDEGIDTGDILLQIPFSITPDDSISDVIAKMNMAAYEGTKDLCKRLLLDGPAFSLLPLYDDAYCQNHTLANYWRRRTSHDTILDLRMSASAIIRTVRSFAPPYACANLVFEDHVLKIVSASLAPVEMTAGCIQRTEPGRIVIIEGRFIRVKADDVIVDLECGSLIPMNLLKAKYIHPPSKYLIKWSVVGKR